MSKTKRKEPIQKPKKPRQVKRERVMELMQADAPRPEPIPERVHWSPLG